MTETRREKVQMDLSREELLKLLHNVGSHQVFYRWLLQNDLLAGEIERYAFQIIGTEWWHQIFEKTSQFPDHLSIVELRFYTDDLQPFYRSERAVPPDATSVWHEFYLDQEAYLAATTALNTVIHSML